jgi:hypothetical protein
MISATKPWWEFELQLSIFGWVNIDLAFMFYHVLPFAKSRQIREASALNAIVSVVKYKFVIHRSA